MVKAGVGMRTMLMMSNADAGNVYKGEGGSLLPQTTGLSRCAGEMLAQMKSRRSRKRRRRRRRKTKSRRGVTVMAPCP